ncbi:type IV secretion protein Rhs [Pedobacter sp. MR2016-19]|uniref:type VI secretion system Vgr family protein n=1 Tax=unclassified Pedobacter TaxID=2628915 RepID=UPI001873788C|nr:MULTISPECIES: phage baseplate assembly protein V [unclassified Pedobacter]MBE5320508.1 type IV secretion protein Rhs [Pedobacter sp. MR2016-19]QXU41139.1 type IV secretion protein Rhs [Pedobacter sp. D749]
MEKKLITEINIEDKAITHFASFSLKQAFNVHHYFELRFNHDQMGLPGMISLNDSRDFVGKTLTASFGYDAGNLQEFVGLVTKVELAQSHGYHGVLIVSGYSPTILIDRGADLGSYLDKDLNSIVNLATSDVPSNDIKIVANAARKEPIDYLIQYRESDFDFLNRLSGEYHEWFYYDGKQLNFGKPDDQKEVALVYGRDVQNLQYAMEIAPIKNKRFAYNPKQDEMLQSESSGASDGSPDLAHAIQVSNTMYSKTFNQPALIRVDNSNDIKSHVQNEEKAHISNLLKVNASGDNAALGIGSIAEITMSIRKELSFSTESLGKFLITTINHDIDGTGKYYNTFEGVVATTERLSVKNYTKPNPDMQLADVVDNADPQGQGRIKVKFKWECKTNDVTEWLRVITPDAGSSDKVSKNRGFVFIPEIGDQVALTFEEGNIARPIVLGSVFHGKSGSGGSSSNNSKSLTSKSGHTLTMDDGAGMVMKDKDSNFIELDGAGKAVFETKESILIKCGESSIFMDKTGKIIIKGKDILTLGENIGNSAKTSIGIGVGPEDGTPTSGIGIEAQTLDIGTKTLSMSGENEANLASKKINVGGESETNIRSGTINLN